MNREEIKVDGELIEKASKEILLRAGIFSPTEYQEAVAMEAVKYANINLYSDLPAYTFVQYWEKKEFEVKSFAYFMRNNDPHNPEAAAYFHNHERTELEQIQSQRKLVAAMESRTIPEEHEYLKVFKEIRD